MPLWIPITSWGKVVTTKQKEKPKTHGRKPKANTCKTQTKTKKILPGETRHKNPCQTTNLAPASSNSPCKIVFKDRKNTAAKEKLHPTTEKFTSLKEQIAPPPEQWKTGVVWNGSQRWEGFLGKRYVLAHFFLFQIFGIGFF